MSATRFGRAQKATALVPLALLSAAWTASLASVGTASTPVSAEAPGSLPDGSGVPTQAIEAPASVSAPQVVSPALRGADPAQVIAGSATSAIPAAALAAYQRAETVINSADPTCRLSWQLVAAIGRVESDHGRFGGNQLDSTGLAVPGIYGPALDGSPGTRAIADTDAGQFDNDTTWDRAVGPMQFIPSTWSVVGVDADGDGMRNPQDVDDAALASAVYLCSGADDLSTDAGQRAAVFRYNHSKPYVDLVLAIAAAYLDGDYSSVPNSTTSAGYLVPIGGPATTETRAGKKEARIARPGGRGRDRGSRSTKPDKDETVAAAPPAAQPTAPGQQPGGGSGDGSGAGGGAGGGNGSGASKGGLGIPGAPTITLPALPNTGVDPLDQVLSAAQARLQCTLDGYFDNLLRTDDPFDLCVQRYTS